MVTAEFATLLNRVRGCTLCRDSLPLAPRPILQLDPRARILVAGQAPGVRAHESGRPFDDASGRRLRDWMGVDETQFYDPTRVAILPMGLCYPGRGPSGDRPPRPECAPTWRDTLLAQLPDLAVTLVIGRHALGWHLPDARGPLAEVVRARTDVSRGVFPMPHPSPRNNRWLKQHPWFEAEQIPLVRRAVRSALDEHDYKGG